MKSGLLQGLQQQVRDLMAKFDKETGARLLGNSGKELFPVDDNTKAQDANLAMISSKPAFLVRNAQNNGTQPTPLSVVMLKEDGDFLFSEKYKDIATSNIVKNRVSFTTDGSQLYAVWEENRTGTEGGNRTYIQNFDPQAYLATGEVPKKLNLTVYPNPVSSVINLSSDKKISTSQIYDLNGKLVKSATDSKINVETLEKGAYIIKVTMADGTTASEKIIKK